VSVPDKVRYYYPNNMGRIILLGMEEVIGQTSLNDVLSTAHLHHLIQNYPANNFDTEFRFDELSNIQATLEKMYGQRGGHGVALRIGRACFKYGLREFGPNLGVTEQEFRLLPLKEKLITGADLLADMFNKYSDQRVRIEESNNQILWYIDRCPVCWGRHTDATVCHLAVGILQEALYWVSSGRFYSVKESRCIAKGDPSCCIVIDKQPLD